MEILTVLNNNVLDVGGSGSDQGTLIAKAVDSEILIPLKIQSDEKFLRVVKNDTKVIYPTRSYLETIRELQPDILLIHFMDLALLRELPQIREHCKIITVAHENWTDLWITDRKRFVIPYFLEFLKLSDAVVTLSMAQQNTLQNLTRTKIVTIPPAIEFERYKNIEAHTENNEFITGGRLVPIKAHFNLFPIFVELSKRHPDIFLKVFEDGLLRQNYDLLIEQLKLTQHIGVWGNVQHEQFISQLCTSKALITSSINENNSVAEIESGALGIPVLKLKEGPAAHKYFKDSMEILINDYPAVKEDVEQIRDEYKRYDISVIKEQYKRLFLAVGGG